MPSDETIVIFTDGACHGNPGPGGWGAVLRFGEHEKQLHGGDKATTNNRMELMAAIMALEAITVAYPVQLWTDSKYVRNGSALSRVSATRAVIAMPPAPFRGEGDLVDCVLGAAQKMSGQQLSVVIRGKAGDAF